MMKILGAVLFPILMGIVLFACPIPEKKRKMLLGIVSFALVMELVLLGIAFSTYDNGIYECFRLMHTIPVIFACDLCTVLFGSLAAVVFVCAGFFSFEYMKHEGHEKRYFGFYLLAFGVIEGLCFAGNVVTFYLFFEMLTLCTAPLVLHNGKHESIMAALKYLLYSLFGAYMVLFGVYFIYRYGATLTFTPGGVIGETILQFKEPLLLVIMLSMILGFSVKAGMFPMHAWLPSAHPVAPAPASAVLSAMIVKAGVLGIVRVVYYLFGMEIFRGSYVQTIWATLSLITVFMGSMLAYREPVLKKRLAYSTVSQLSYILFGLSVATINSVTGSMLHVLAHGAIKAVLFLCAGAIIYKTGKTRVDELRGIGKEMPITIWCYTIASLGLIGIPPTGGFISKWYLAEGALESEMPVFSWLGPVILLISALLTAGYLLPITINGFFPGADFSYETLEKKEPNLWMLIPIVVLTVLSVVLGLFPGLLTNGLALWADTLL